MANLNERSHAISPRRSAGATPLDLATKKAHQAKRTCKKVVIQRILLALSILLVICFCVVCGIPEEKDYNDFLDDLGSRESSDRYDVENRFGYMGRYQMGELALQDAGFLDSDGGWTSLANSYGIYSKADFLQSPEGQDAAIRASHRKLWVYIRNYGLDEYVGTSYCDVEITESGLLAACHLVGVKNMKVALQNNEMVYDGNQVPASEYMELFSGYDISEFCNGNS